MTVSAPGDTQWSTLQVIIIIITTIITTTRLTVGRVKP